MTIQDDKRRGKHVKRLKDSEDGAAVEMIESTSSGFFSKYLFALFFFSPLNFWLLQTTASAATITIIIWDHSDSQDFKTSSSNIFFQTENQRYWTAIERRRALFTAKLGKDDSSGKCSTISPRDSFSCLGEYIASLDTSKLLLLLSVP